VVIGKENTVLVLAVSLWLYGAAGKIRELNVLWRLLVLLAQ